MEQPSSIQSLDRAFSLLEILSHHPDGVHLMELSRMTGLHKSTVHRFLSALITLGYVKKVGGEDGKYALTLRLFELSGRVVEGVDVLDVAKPVLEKLRDIVGETVHLVLREGTEIVYVFKAESFVNTYRMISRIGTRRSMYSTAAGKSILATMPPDKVQRIWDASTIEAYTKHTITTLDALTAELDLTRERGYALDNEENELGVRCIAAAVLDYTGKSHAAFSISAPLVRMADDRVAELAPLVLAAQKEISTSLGWRG